MTNAEESFSPGDLVTIVHTVNRTAGGQWRRGEIGIVIDTALDPTEGEKFQLDDSLILVSFGDRGTEKFHITRLARVEQNQTGEDSEF